MKIRDKLTMNLAIAVAMIAIAEVVLFKIAAIALQRKIAENAGLLAMAVMDEIEVGVGSKIEKVETLAVEISGHPVIERSNADFDAMADYRAYIEQVDKEWLETPPGVTTELMRQLFENDLGNKIRGVAEAQGFYLSRYGYEIFSEVFVANKYGANVAMCRRTTDYYQADEFWWQQAKENGIFVSDVEYDESSGVYSIVVAAGINDSSLNFIGVLKMVMNIQFVIDMTKNAEYAMERMMSGEPPDNRAGIKLYTHTGKLVYSTEPNSPFMSQIPDNLSEAIEQADMPMGYFMSKNDESGGKQQLVAFARSRGNGAFPGIGWVVVAEQDLSHALLPVTSLRNKMFITLIALLVVVVIISVIVSRNISGPLAILSDAALRIGEGDMNVEIPVYPRSEMGQLADSFRTMTRKLATANKVLATTQQNMQTIIKSSADGLLIIDKNRIVRFMNPAAEVIFGQKAADMMGERFELPLTIDEPSEVQLAAAGGRDVTVEVQAVQTEWEGEQVHLATVRDITLRQKAEKEISLANERLRRFNDLKDEFVSMASHELRTPLSIIIGSVKLVLDRITGDISSEQKEVLEIAMNNLDRLTRIVNELLDISKIESGKIELHMENTDIRSIIEETVSEYQKKADEKGIHLGLHLPERPVNLFVDRDRIKEVLVNLISNGLKFTPPDGSIEAGCIEKRDEVTVYVKDTGYGIAKDDLPRLFEKFVQFCRKAGPGEKGTGLGLAISKGIVELHKGRILVESSLNKGTKISFVIPRDAARLINTNPAGDVTEKPMKRNGEISVVSFFLESSGEFDEQNMRELLAGIGEVVKLNLRCATDTIMVREFGTIFVCISDCDREHSAKVGNRLRRVISDYLTSKGLADRVKLNVRMATYPDVNSLPSKLLDRVKQVSVAGSE